MSPKVKKAIDNQIIRTQKKRPHLTEIQVVSKEGPKGSFFTKLIAKSKRKTHFLKVTDFCQLTSIRKVFGSLIKKSEKKKRERQGHKPLTLIGGSR